jgi:pimeloyl-ACP methyl ester carboxylesterase
LALVALAVSGAVYNWLAVRHLRSIYPPPGKLYAVNGKAMHLYCTGEGAPTVVLEAGMGNDSLIWVKVQPPLSKTTLVPRFRGMEGSFSAIFPTGSGGLTPPFHGIGVLVCSYDRIGVGWSEAQDGGHDSNSVADRLHVLLSEAEVRGSIVLMGHSIGGIHIRSYAFRFPREVAGLVLVDSPTPLEVTNVSAEVRALRHDADRDISMRKWRTALGMARLMGECSRVQSGFESYTDWVKADSCIPSQFDALLAEASASEASGQETLGTGPFGDLPVLVVSSDLTVSPPGSPFSAEVLQRMATVRNAGQEDLKKLSTRSRRIIAKGSGHYVQIDRADLLNREVPVFIDEIRTHAMPSKNGTTETE